MAAADPRQASLPRVCRRPRQNCSHQPVPKQELIRTITNYCVPGKNLGCCGKLFSEAHMPVGECGHCEGKKSMPGLESDYAPGSVQTHTQMTQHSHHRKKESHGPCGLITMQQHQPIFSGALWLHCRLQGLLLRGPKKSLLRQNQIFFLALRCRFRKFIRLRRLFRTRAQRMLGTNREKTQNLQSFAQLNSP